MKQTFTAYVLEKNGMYWSRTKAKFVPSPAEGSTFADRAEVEALALTSEVPAEHMYQEVHPKTKRVINVGRDIPYSPPANILEVKIEVPHGS